MRILIGILLCGVWFAGRAGIADSLRTEEVDGTVFIIHQVDPQETLYALSRRYHIPIPEIIKHNPESKSGLEIGQILRIPYVVPDRITNSGGVHVVKPGETLFYIAKKYEVEVDDVITWNKLPNSNLRVGQQLLIRKDPDFNVPVQRHIVAAGETLFAIAKTYDVSVEDVQRWNELQDHAISIGQSLIVGYIEKTQNNQQVNQADSLGTMTDEDEIANQEDDKVLDDGNQDEIDENEEEDEGIVTRSTDYQRVVETGVAAMIEGSNEDKKYLALHKTAKPGTILQIRNEMNNRVVFVRVIGKLPATGINSGLLIRLSKAAYDRLGAINKKFRVEISYVP